MIVRALRGGGLTQPAHADNLNYAGVAVGIVLVGALLSFFFPVIGAYKWYRGERHTIDDFSVSIRCPLPSHQTPRGADQNT